MRLYIYTDASALSDLRWTTDVRDVVAKAGRVYLGAVALPGAITLPASGPAACR